MKHGLGVTDPVLVNGYRLVSRLGAGGMATVFYALAPGGQPVAVKVLHAVPEAPKACRREYQLAAAVAARCTAAVLDHGVSAAGAYLVTAYLPGYRCATTLGRGTMPIEQLWTFGLGLARALASIHARGIVHCDVKPANLLIRDDDVRVIDFGIARYIGKWYELQGSVQCSRGWAAPEQLRDAPATPAVDIFAWGCVLAYLACGVHPFASRDEQEWILRVQSAEPDLPRLPARSQAASRSSVVPGARRRCRRRPGSGPRRTGHRNFAPDPQGPPRKSVHPGTAGGAGRRSPRSACPPDAPPPSSPPLWGVTWVPAVPQVGWRSAEEAALLTWLSRP
jgi:serine/threonine protein kinase